MPLTSASAARETTTKTARETTRLRCTDQNDVVDTRWSMAVAAGFIAFVGVASMSNLGFFYVYFLEEFHTNRQNASWPGSVLQIMGHVAGIIVAVLQRFLSTFYIGLLGSVVLWVGLLFAVLAPNIAWMTVTFGFLHGAGVGIIMVTVIVSIMSHFRKYRGLAAGFKYTGNTLASLLLPKVLSSLQDVYTFRGTLLIYAALSMHATAFTLFLKERKKGKKLVQSNPATENNSRTDLSSAPSQALYEPGQNKEHKDLKKTNVNKEDLDGSGYVTHTTVQLNRAVPIPSREKPFLCKGAPLKYISDATSKIRDLQEWPDIQNAVRHPEHLGPVKLTGNRQNNDEVGADKRSNVRKQEYHLDSDGYEMPKFDDVSKQFCNRRRKSTASEHSYGILGNTAAVPPLEKESSAHPPSQSYNFQSSNFQLFTSPTFYVLVIGAIAADFTTIVVHATIVDYALDKGVARKSAEMSMTYCSSTELVGRLLLPLAADLRFVSRTNLVAMCFTAMAATSLALPHTASFASYIPVQVATALFIACVATLKGVLVADSFGADAVPTFWGANGIALIPVLLGNPFITGYFRDTMGSYDNLFRLLAGVQLFTAGVFYTLACFQRKRNLSLF